MIAADTSTWINFLKGIPDIKAGHLESGIAEGRLLMPPPVLMELLSFSGVEGRDQKIFEMIPQLEVVEGFWERAGELRRRFLKKNLKASSMDCLIAQSCMDHDIALIAHDDDFRHFSKLGLKLA